MLPIKKRLLITHKDQLRGGWAKKSHTAVSYTVYQAIVLGMARTVNGRFRHSCHAKIKNNNVKSPAAINRKRGSG
ncbi:MAG: hypothetical protein DHS20C20_13160 [Ardenticatenaceae bacterium]|nr:MAG: hypothetical protein DHS20C20_13160 [Ardenticatenaceae bacterium]